MHSLLSNALVPRLYNTHLGEIKVYPLPPSLPPDPCIPLASFVTMTIPAFVSKYPGVLWLLFSLPRIVAPALLVYTFISSFLALLVGWDTLDGSRWKVAVASALTFPSAFFCSITWNRLKIAYRAHRLGATTPPVIAGRLPGSLDIVWPIAKNRFTAYPGEQTLPVLYHVSDGCCSPTAVLVVRYRL